MVSVEPVRTRRRPWWRAHGLFLLALVAAVAVRVTVMVAYRPVLLFPDSFGYLRHTIPFRLMWQRPAGYQALLWPLVHLPHWRYLVPALQHLMGLGLAIACYAFLVRRGLPRWGATLAVLPLLFDPLQLVLEHYLLSDTLFELLLVGACLLLLWHPRPGYWAMALAGLAMAGATLTRGAGTLIILVFVIALLCLRVGWRRMVTFLVAAIIPLGVYSVAYHQQYGSYAITSAGPRFLYARLATIVRCHPLQLPSYERPLCPQGPPRDREVINWYIWGHQRAPQWQVPPPPGMTQLQMVKDYDKRVVRQQPLVFTRSVITHFAMGFAPSRAVHIGGNPSEHWLFEDHYWVLDRLIKNGFQPPSARAGTSSNHAAATFMTRYRTHLWTPGPLLALLGLVGLVAAFGVGRSRWSGDRVAIGLLLGACLVPLATGAAVSGFSWRYQMPQLPMLPLAGALGIAALGRGRAPGRTVDTPLRLLDSTAAALARLPMPAGLRSGLERGCERGVVQWLLALLAGVAAGVVSGLVVVRSGWADPAHCAGGGLVVGVVVTVLLLVSRAHAARPLPDTAPSSEQPEPAAR